MISHVEIQLQEESGNWRTMAVTINDSQQIRVPIDEVKRQFPSSRVRAVDAGGLGLSD